MNDYELLMAVVEFRFYKNALAKSKGNQSEIARKYNFNRGTLRNKLLQYGFIGDNYKRHTFELFLSNKRIEVSLEQSTRILSMVGEIRAEIFI